MKIASMKNISLALAASLALCSGVSVAEENVTVPVVTPVSASVVSDTVKLINIAGKQRMLSQRIAKDYMYIGKKISTSKATRQSKHSLEALNEAHQVLVQSINDPEIKNLLAFVEMSTEDFQVISQEAFSLDNAQLILDLSESMLEGSQYVVDSLKQSVKLEESHVVEMAGKQRMLAQRIAKYYIAYQAGIKDKNTVDQMQVAVQDFATAHEALMVNTGNTPEINRKLNQIDRLWKIVYKFYLNIEKGGLPLIVFNSTDTITKKMDEVTARYVELHK